MYSFRALADTSKGVLFKSFTAVFSQISDRMYRNGQVPGPDWVTTWPLSVMPSNATRYTDHLHILLCSSTLWIQRTLLIQGAGKECSALIVPNQVNQNLVGCKQDIFQWSNYRIYLFIYILYFYWYWSYIFKQVHVLVWLQLGLVWYLLRHMLLW